MRLSTAITVAITVLLTSSLLGAVAATPAVSADSSIGYERTDAVADRSPGSLERVSHPGLSTDSTVKPTGSSLSTPAATQSADSLENPDPKQVIRLTVRDNGDVRWTIESRFLLTNESDADVFREYADSVTSGQRDVAYDLEKFENYRRTAERETGREMSIEDAQWDEPRIIDAPDSDDPDGETIDNGEDVDIGVLSYSFTWTNFATVDGDRIYFGDAFETEQGTWIGLVEGQRLVIETPPDFALETPTRLTWNGPYEFAADELDIVFVRTGSSVIPMTGWLIGSGLLFVVLIGTGGYLLARRDDRIGFPVPTDRLPSLLVENIGRRHTDGRSEPTERADGTGAEPGAGKPSPDPSGSVAAATDGDTGTQLEFEEPGYDGIDPELLSDEERVLRLLKRNGGRMKQASIVSETGWSNAKVSQLLSKMDDDDEIEKLRIGRENLITLPGVDPTEID